MVSGGQRQQKRHILSSVDRFIFTLGAIHKLHRQTSKGVGGLVLNDVGRINVYNLKVKYGDWFNIASRQSGTGLTLSKSKTGTIIGVEGEGAL